MLTKQADNSRPMPMDTPTSVFVDEWKACIENASHDTTRLFTMLDPFIAHWKSQITAQTYDYHINYLTLCNLLSDDLDESLNMIRCWVDWAEKTSSVESELRYLLLERIRKFKYFPTQANPIMAEYVIGRDFKLALNHYIRDIWRKHNRDALLSAEHSIDFDAEYSYTYPDYIMWKNLNLDTWQSYIIKLIIDEYSSKDRSDLTLVHRRNLYLQEKKIWDLIKLKLLDS